jgi:hypothetical protein
VTGLLDERDLLGNRFDYLLLFFLREIERLDQGFDGSNE